MAYIDPLPSLPVLRETYCPKQMTDEIISCLQTNYPEALERIRQYDQGFSDGATLPAYAKAMRLVVDEVSKTLTVPNTDLGYIDLSFELCRRYRAAYGFHIPTPKGRPLAPDLSGPYPKKLLSVPIQEKTIKAGFNQVMVDYLVNKYYIDNLQRCYVCAEAYSRYQAVDIMAKRVYEIDYFEGLIREFTGDESLAKGRAEIASEATTRICKTCEII